ncbi:hypothetical protein MYK68_05190 [Gordonia sp. PP30]|uniref:COG4705 family protein n=1 Tax=Gordonia sp. PP30 TaxID=2935861 RepID=UPI00200037CD|nr:hypothetical protein [Gordonia sp. PP30]UQE75994.1 hypothetical protein MYK68_05190 [Gordonia sp. PP30]
MTHARSAFTTVLLSKVPEVTLYFWIIKILSTTVGETAADYLNMNLGFGLRWTTLITVVLLAAVLTAQFRLNRYVPAVYWAAVLLISVTGTLITDNLTDVAGVPLPASTTVFAIALAVVLVVWYRVEGTLSIHSIRTRRREAFYWLTVLVTFALGTAAGDLIAEKLSVGYGWSLAIFAVVIALIFAAHRGLGLGAVPAFWAGYIVTRPLGASAGDLLIQPASAGGLGLSSTLVNVVFLAVIVVLVAYLSISRVDRIDDEGARADAPLAA